jgi:hypothetical protein
MDVIYTIDKNDKGEPYWKLSIDINRRGYIEVKVQNYKYGFSDGQEWDKIFIHDRYRNSYQVSLMTKSSYEELMTRYDEVVTAFYNNLFDIEKRLNEEFTRKKISYDSNISQLSSVKSSDLFKNIYRDEKIKEVLNAD